MKNNQNNKSVREQVITVKSNKSAAISILLTVLFGSFGLFYSTITGGLIMTFLFPPAIITLFLTGKITTAIILCVLFYPICIIWGVRAVNNFNKKLLEGITFEPLVADEIDKVKSTISFYRDNGKYLFYDIIIFTLIIIDFITFLLVK